jgi:precorrin-6B methylase 2
MSLSPNAAPAHQAADREIIIQMISGSLVAQLVHVAARLGIADLPQAGELFNEAMTNLTRPHAAAVLAAYDFAGIRTLADVGGGNGTLIAAILAAYPHLQGILFEQRDVLDSARQTLERAGVLSRCTLTEGDFFQSAPQGCDAYVLKDIIHDWEDERALVILENCRQAMGAGGKLLLVERAVPLGNAPAAGKLIDVAMLAITGGCERTEAEYHDLLARAGFQLTRVVPTPSEMVIVEAVPAGSAAGRSQTRSD